PTVLSVLLDGGADPNARDDDGLMSLHYAVQWRPPSVTQLLLKAGANPHSRDNKGCTPLFCATVHDKTGGDWVGQVIALRNAGASMDEPDYKGITPLHHAVSSQSVRTACLLLRLGADPYAGRVYDPVPLRFA
ncbi:hypothetical protein BOTBODRAFT_87455, partial [Botryobasidium botryosum FD-172 SS1]